MASADLVTEAQVAALVEAIALHTSSLGGGSTSGNIDGGSPDSIYGGTTPIDGGTP